jgi:CubicO group peptidase (beta-lactamase class C family)
MTLALHFDEYLSALARLQRFNGSVLVAQHRQICFERSFGYANFESLQNLQSETVFKIGSLSKQFTAFALLNLIHEQGLELQTPLRAFLPEYPYAESITLQDLLGHRAGLPADSVKLPGTPSLTEVVEANKCPGFVSLPGTAYHYSNLGYTLLAWLIEHLSGQPFAAYLKKAIFEPLQMFDTAHGDGHAKAERFALGYRLSQGMFLQDAEQNVESLYGAGSLTSTLRDLFRWAEALSGRAAYKSELFQAMVHPPAGASYHLGLECQSFRQRRLLSHLGLIHSFRSCFLRYPDQDLTIIMLSNLQPIPLLELKETLSAIAFGESYSLPQPIQRQAIPLADEALADYAGLYRVEQDPAQTLSIRLVAGQLFQDEGEGLTLLYPEAADRFFLEPDSVTTLSFIRDARQQVSGIRYLTPDGWEARLVKES